jgi:hypothetical protein
LTGQAAFAKEVSFAQDAERRFFPSLRHYAQLHLALLDKKRSIRSIALSEDRAFLSKRHHFSAFANGRQKGAGIEIGFSYAGDFVRHKALLTECSQYQLWGRGQTQTGH